MQKGSKLHNSKYETLVIDKITKEPDITDSKLSEWLMETYNFSISYKSIGEWRKVYFSKETVDLKKKALKAAREKLGVQEDNLTVVYFAKKVLEIEDRIKKLKAEQTRNITIGRIIYQFTGKGTPPAEEISLDLDLDIEKQLSDYYKLLESFKHRIYTYTGGVELVQRIDGILAEVMELATLVFSPYIPIDKQEAVGIEFLNKMSDLQEKLRAELDIKVLKQKSENKFVDVESAKDT